MPQPSSGSCGQQGSALLLRQHASAIIGFLWATRVCTATTATCLSHHRVLVGNKGLHCYYGNMPQPSSGSCGQQGSALLLRQHASAIIGFLWTTRVCTATTATCLSHHRVLVDNKGLHCYYGNMPQPPSGSYGQQGSALLLRQHASAIIGFLWTTRVCTATTATCLSHHRVLVGNKGLHCYYGNMPQPSSGSCGQQGSALLLRQHASAIIGLLWTTRVCTATTATCLSHHRVLVGNKGLHCYYGNMPQPSSGSCGQQGFALLLRQHASAIIGFLWTTRVCTATTATCLSHHRVLRNDAGYRRRQRISRHSLLRLAAALSLQLVANNSHHNLCKFRQHFQLSVVRNIMLMMNNPPCPL